jgi:putative ABC transport system ATP-binding protein
MVTHDPVAASYADTVLFLADGRLVDELRSPDTAETARRMAALDVRTAPAPRKEAA